MLYGYHGSDTLIKEFNHNFLDRDFFEDSTNDRYGPGIYITTLMKESQAYGKYIHHVKVHDGNFWQDNEKHTNEWMKRGPKIMKKAVEWQSQAQNWAMDPNDGLEQALYSYMDYNNDDADFLQQLWIDWHRDTNRKFVEACVAAGIDGIVINDDQRTYAERRTLLVVYNVKLIEILDVSENVPSNEGFISFPRL